MNKKNWLIIAVVVLVALGIYNQASLGPPKNELHLVDTSACIGSDCLSLVGLVRTAELLDMTWKMEAVFADLEGIIKRLNSFLEGKCEGPDCKLEVTEYYAKVMTEPLKTIPNSCTDDSCSTFSLSASEVDERGLFNPSSCEGAKAECLESLGDQVEEIISDDLPIPCADDCSYYNTLSGLSYTPEECNDADGEFSVSCSMTLTVCCGDKKKSAKWRIWAEGKTCYECGSSSDDSGGGADDEDAVIFVEHKDT